MSRIYSDLSFISNSIRLNSPEPISNTSSVKYKFSSSLVMSNPSNGFLRMNNNTLNLVTSIVLSDTDNNWGILTNLYTQLDNISNIISKGTLYIKLSDDKYIIFDILTTNKVSGYITLVGVVSGYAGTSFTLNDTLSSCLIPGTSSFNYSSFIMYGGILAYDNVSHYSSNNIDSEIIVPIVAESIGAFDTKISDFPGTGNRFIGTLASLYPKKISFVYSYNTYNTATYNLRLTDEDNTILSEIYSISIVGNGVDENIEVLDVYFTILPNSFQNLGKYINIGIEIIAPQDPSIGVLNQNLIFKLQTYYIFD
jgi:hypothetical protein